MQYLTDLDLKAWKLVYMGQQSCDSQGACLLSSDKNFVTSSFQYLALSLYVDICGIVNIFCVLLQFYKGTGLVKVRVSHRLPRSQVSNIEIIKLRHISFNPDALRFPMKGVLIVPQP